MTTGRTNTRTKHFGRLVGCAFQFSQKEAEEMFVGTFEIISDAGKEPNAVNVPPATKVKWWAPLVGQWRNGSPKIEATIDGLRACGWVGAKLRDVPLLFKDGELDRQVFLTVEHYQGKMKVAFVDESRGGGSNEDMTDAHLDEMSARLEAVVAALKPKSERRAAAKQPPPDDLDGPPPGEPYGTGADADYPL